MPASTSPSGSGSHPSTPYSDNAVRSPALSGSHPHASLLINQGCDALILADRLGHEKVSTTLNTYSHLFPHKQQELVTNLEQLATNAPVTPTLEPPMGNPLLDTLEKASGKVIPMPQRKAI